MNGLALPRIASILLAGGAGSRFSATEDKLLISLNAVPVIAYSAAAVFNLAEVCQRIVVCSPDKRIPYEQAISKLIPDATRLTWAPAGVDRRASVWSGLLLLKPDVDWVLIHDAARPLVTAEQVKAFANRFCGQGGSAFAHPVVDTIKQQQPDGQWCTLPRQSLWATETPQLFDTFSLVQAHQTIKKTAEVTDDLQLIELANTGPVHLWHNPNPNLKITNAGDTDLLNHLL